MKDLSIESLDFKYTNKKLIVNIASLIWRGYKHRDINISAHKQNNQLHLNIKTPSLEASGMFDFESKKLFLKSCHTQIDQDTYTLTKPSEIWPCVKNIELTNLAKNNEGPRIKIKNVQIKPFLKCDELLLEKIPLKYFHAGLNEATLSANLFDFSGDFVSHLPGKIELNGQLKTEETKQRIYFNTVLKDEKTIFLNSHGFIDDFYLFDNAQLDAQLDSNIDLKSLAFLFPRHMSGAITGNLQAKGHLNNLNLTGKINASDLSYEDPQSGVILQNGRMAISCQGKTIVLHELYTDDHSPEKGSIKGTGTFNLETNQGFIKAIAENFQPLHYHPVYMKLTGPITLKLSPTIDIQAKLTARNVRINVDQFKKPYQKFMLLDTNNPRQKKTKEFSIIKNGLLQITIEGAVDLYSKLLKSFWTGHLDLKCQEGKWKFLGELISQKGEMLFLDKKLKMRSGTIKFNGKKEPKLNVSFSTHILDHTIIVTLLNKGPSLRTHISAEPALQTEDAYAYLLFGTKKQSLSNFQTAKLLLAIASVNSGEGGILQKLPNKVDVYQRQQNDGQDEEILRFSQSFGNTENTNFAFEKGVHTSNMSAKVERQVANHIKTYVGVVSNNVRQANFGGEFGVSYGKNY